MKDTQKTGIYIHIPFCRSRCSYCGFVSCTDIALADKYVEKLAEEIEERFSGEADTVYLGGGTPSVLPQGYLRKIFNTLRKNAELSADCEITVEANPDSCTDEFLEEAVSVGVNRLSLGVQSLNDKVLARIGRRHNSAQAYDAVMRTQKSGISNVSCDLMLGLPAQSERDVCYAVNSLADCGVKHISVYALSVERGTAMHKSGYRPDEDAAADMYALACEDLSKRGFSRYEVSNFCKDGLLSRHNYKYWTLAPYIGLGAAAHSFYDGARRRNTSDVKRYISGFRDEKCETINKEEALEEYIMLGLRTSAGIVFSKLDELYEGDWRKSRCTLLNELSKAGFIDVTDLGIKLKSDAFYVMNEIILRLI